MLLDVFVTAFLVLTNGFFVAAEFAIVKVRASQLELKAQKGNQFAVLGKHIVLHLDGYLAATQLGITIASLGLGWIGEPVVSQIILAIVHAVGIRLEPATAHAIALPVAFFTITVLHIVFGELAPKSIAIQRSEATTLAIVYPLHFFFILFRPVIWLLNGIANLLLGVIGIRPLHGAEVHSSDELQFLVQQGSESGTLESDNYAIIQNAFGFTGRTVKEILIPRSRVLSIDIDAFNDDVLLNIIEEGYSRIPCYENNHDNIVGVVHLKELLIHLRNSPATSIRDVMRPVMFIPETQRIGQLLKDFQLKRQQLAVVVNEFGGTQGIITMEDILEELVGEIQDEYDSEAQLIEQIDTRTFSVHASASLNEVNNVLPHPILKDGQYETLAGYLLYRFGHIPRANESLVSDGYEFTITKMNRSAIALVRLRVLSDPSENVDGAA